MILKTLYNGVTHPIRSTIDAATEGTLMNKTKDEAYNIIQEMTLNNYQWSNERGQHKRVRGKRLEFVAITLVNAKVDAMCQRLE